VTLGGYLSQDHLKELGTLVKDVIFGTDNLVIPSMPVYDKVPIVKRDIITGKTKNIKIIPYKWSDYIGMAEACIQYAMTHPKYIAR